MARHTVKSFTVSIDPSNTFVYVEIHTELRKPYIFHLTPDIHYPNLQFIHDKLNSALTHCTTNYEKVEVRVFDERFYVNIDVAGFIDTRFTGKKA
jgi:hypothetical protein